MRYLKLIVICSIVILVASCKKAYTFSKADLIGKWTQIPPFAPNYDSAYTFQFTNDSAFAFSPYTGSGVYTLVNDHTLKSSCAVTSGPQCGMLTDSFQISGSPTRLTFKKFFGYGSLSGQGTTLDLYMQKTN